MSSGQRLAVCSCVLALSFIYYSYQYASKKARGSKNIFSVEHDRSLQVQKKHRKISDNNRKKQFN